MAKKKPRDLRARGERARGRAAVASPRAQRREAERAGVKLAEARMKLAKLEPGGAPDRPIEVASASVVEPHAASLRCTACGESTRVEEHLAVTVPDDVVGGPPRPLRIARLRCPRCGVRRDVYFRIGTVLPS